MEGRSPKSAKLGKRWVPRDRGFRESAQPRSVRARSDRETTRVIRAVQVWAGDKDRTQLPPAAGSLTQPDHVARGASTNAAPRICRRQRRGSRVSRPIADLATEFFRQTPLDLEKRLENVP